MSSTRTIAVIGLGYVGLPLAVEFGKRRAVVGFDIDEQRVTELRAGEDKTLEVSGKELAEATRLVISSDPNDLQEANIYIVTAPTPINEHKQPDLRPLLSATRTVAERLSPGDIVIFESTVYPGATEEECVPVLESVSGLTFNEDFFVGYSPERMNPGDKERRVTDIVKVTSGSTPEAADAIDALYNEIVEAGTHKAPTIKVAEAAKVIENTQRDVNIALMNELAILFNKLDIETRDVLAAAGTKWNFLPFRPGLVGGHCIGVDPYYLTHKAQEVGYHPEIILAGRRINDSMGKYVASQLVKKMAQKGLSLRASRVLILGLTFKENTPDLRNTKVVDVIRELEDYGIDVDVYDPVADKRQALEEYGLELLPKLPLGQHDAVLLAVPHKEVLEDLALAPVFQGEDAPVLFDVKGVLEVDSVGRL